MVVPDTSGAEVRRFRVPRAIVGGALGGAALLVVVAVVATALAVRARAGAEEGGRLRAENSELRRAILALEARVARSDRAVERLSGLERKVRAMTVVSDPARSIAMGPVGGRVEPGEPQADLDPEVFGADPDGGAARVEARATAVGDRARRAANRLEGLSVFLEREAARLASTPSRRPTRGYVSSVFGMRIDPFTGLPQRHAGLDFSAPVGTEVRATADGVVRSAGRHGAYGLLVEIDHGQGLTTRYAHLSKVLVRAGAKIERGVPIGEVGNSGRSTGPHLHYEVRLHGVPRDPRSFILE